MSSPVDPPAIQLARALTLSGGGQYAIHGTNRPHTVCRFRPTAAFACSTGSGWARKLSSPPDPQGPMKPPRPATTRLRGAMGDPPAPRYRRAQNALTLGRGTPTMFREMPIEKVGALLRLLD